MVDPIRVFRFAPSPNGELHLGHAYSALLNLKLAREVGGKCLLRIEDIDTVRCTRELEKQMLDDLEWIGFEWDEKPRRQSEHFGEYQDAIDGLQRQGLLYPSTLSRSAIKKIVAEHESGGCDWPRDPDGTPIYPGSERDLNFGAMSEIRASGDAYALRLDMKKAVGTSSFQWLENELVENARPLDWGDVVLGRKDTPTSYHLCCVLDDAIQGVTDVVRGKDLFHATSVHVVLQKLLGLVSPRYVHHDLVLDDDGEKLSKSVSSKSIRSLKTAGLSKEDIWTSLNL